MFCLAFARQGFAKLVETTSPQLPILAQPGIQVPEGLRAKRVKALLALGPDAHESGLLQDAEMPRNAGLVDLDVDDDVIDRMLAAPEDFDDAEPHRVSQGLECLNMHTGVYVQARI